MSFIRQKENFACGHCGAAVVGNGYTNHCPVCLWSKHVDVDPGDRASTCGGLMEPIRVVAKGDGFVVTHRCVVCGHEKKNKASPQDDAKALREIMRAGNERLQK